MGDALAAGATLAPDWRERLRARLLPVPDHRPESWRVGGTMAPPTTAMRAALTREPHPAAVLVPLIDRSDGPTVLLTVRADALRQHGGQISFPGGRLDVADVDPLAAALRETAEETGIEARFVQPLGFLTDHLVLTGFRITPVVALVQPGFTLHAAPGEVSEIFEMPVQHLLHPGNYRAARRMLRGVEIEALDLLYGAHNIWGATAGMLRSLCEAIQERRS